MPETIPNMPLLQKLLLLLTQNDSKKERKEIERYDRLKFVDASKEIKNESRRKEANKAEV